MLKLKSTCKTCQLINAGDSKLEKRINHSKQWVPGGEPLLAIFRDYADRLGKPDSFYNHAKKHQAPTNKQLEQVRAKVALKQIEGEVAVQKVKGYAGHVEARKELIEAGLNALRNDDMKMTANVLASLLKQEADIEAKKTDQSIELMKMFNYFASGAASNPNQKNYGTTSMPAFEGEVIEETMPRERL